MQLSFLCCHFLRTTTKAAVTAEDKTPRTIGTPARFNRSRTPWPHPLRPRETRSRPLARSSISARRDQRHRVDQDRLTAGERLRADSGSEPPNKESLAQDGKGIDTTRGQHRLRSKVDGESPIVLREPRQVSPPDDVVPKAKAARQQRIAVWTGPIGSRASGDIPQPTSEPAPRKRDPCVVPPGPYLGASATVYCRTAVATDHR